MVYYNWYFKKTEGELKVSLLVNYRSTPAFLLRNNLIINFHSNNKMVAFYKL